MQHAVAEIPTVWFIGNAGHADFRDATAQVRATATVAEFADAGRAVTALSATANGPEVIVLVASRPGAIAARDVELLRRRAPLAGVVALLGSWCEGETRTGRPLAGACRLFWYDFPQWWWRQLTLRSAGRCPDWARPGDCGLPNASLPTPYSPRPTPRQPTAGLVLIDATCRETADALADVLRSAGYASVAAGPRGRWPLARGLVGGIWEGRQLDEPEMGRLTSFCRHLAAENAPAVALADFPRRDRADAAHKLGAAAVLAKPWLNIDLTDTLERMIAEQREATYAEAIVRAA